VAGFTLNAHWFLSQEDACEKLEAWRRHYNEERPHSAIGNIPPIMLENSASDASPPDLEGFRVKWNHFTAWKSRKTRDLDRDFDSIKIE
jgi:hypothetical protein